MGDWNAYRSARCGRSGPHIAFCAAGQDLADFDPAQGIGGYVGPRLEIERPIVLRRRARQGILGTVETLSVDQDDSIERVVTVFTGGVTAVRGGVMRRAAVSELTVNGRSISSQQPLVFVESWSDVQGGNVADLSITFPGFVARGMPVPIPDTPQHHLWPDLFAADLANVGRPISAGDMVFGTIKARSGGNELTMIANGHGLIDLASGLSTGTSKTEIDARQGGRVVRRTVVVDVDLLR